MRRRAYVKAALLLVIGAMIGAFGARSRASLSRVVRRRCASRPNELDDGLGLSSRFSSESTGSGVSDCFRAVASSPLA